MVDDLVVLKVPTQAYSDLMKHVLLLPRTHSDNGVFFFSSHVESISNYN